mmetsp:Transcript_11586/g.32134  ORF Transcript_11586/g.32134 Transcript_11586/m.32134 type:complete len:250 (+) Transcript_11586:116-865(+)
MYVCVCVTVCIMTSCRAAGAKSLSLNPFQHPLKDLSEGFCVLHRTQVAPFGGQEDFYSLQGRGFLWTQALQRRQGWFQVGHNLPELLLKFGVLLVGFLHDGGKVRETVPEIRERDHVFIHEPLRPPLQVLYLGPDCALRHLHDACELIECPGVPAAGQGIVHVRRRLEDVLVHLEVKVRCVVPNIVNFLSSLPHVDPIVDGYSEWKSFVQVQEVPVPEDSRCQRLSLGAPALYLSPKVAPGYQVTFLIQ